MNILLLALLVLICILLILVVLLQKPKGGGLSAGFSAPSNIVGAAKSSDLVEKLTWYLSGALIVISIAVNLGNSAEPGTTQTSSEAVEKAGSMKTPAAPAPVAAPAQAPAAAPDSNK